MEKTADIDKYDRIPKVARTIADHVSEAIQYRSLDQKLSVLTFDTNRLFTTLNLTLPHRFSESGISIKY
jgi:hypothetical protein